MRFDKTEILNSFQQFSDPFYICEAFAEDFSVDLDFPLEYYSFFIVTSGHLKFSFRGRSSEADSRKVQFYMKDPSLMIEDVSSDYKSYGIIFSKKYWSDNLLHLNPYINLAVIHPALELTDSQKKELCDYLNSVSDLIGHGIIDKQSPVILTIFRGLFFRLGEFYHMWSDSFCNASESLLFVDFCELLFKNYKSQRSLQFYADSLGVSPATLSTRIKNVIGKPALICIMSYTIARLCSDLGNGKKSIKELAIDYNFNDSSHLCKFFKSYVGESPDVYRHHVHQFIF